MGVLKVVRYIFLVPRSFLDWIVLSLPGSLGYFLRQKYYGKKLKRMGKGVAIGVGVIIDRPRNVSIDDHSHIDNYVQIEGGSSGVEIGRYVHVAPHCLIQGDGGVKIGDYAGVGSGTKIYSSTNYFEDEMGEGKRMTPLAPAEEIRIFAKPVNIGNDAFLGVNCVVLPGVTIGEGAVIGAQGLVLENIPPWSIAVGAPAKVIKKRPKHPYGK